MSAFLADFGLAKSVATGSRLTRTGEALGTPAYMSPEQARGEVSSLTPATDVWSLGCVLYEMLAAHAAFEGGSPAAIVGKVLLSEPPLLRAVCGDAPESVEHVARVCLAKDFRERYRDAAFLREDLARVLADARPQARLPGARKRRLVAGSWGMILVGACGAWGLMATRTGPSSPPALPVASGPSPAEALAAEASRLRQADPQKAAALFREALDRDPSRRDWRLERGMVLWASGDSRQAREEWGSIPPGAPEREAARFFRGLEAWSRLDRAGYAEAIPDLEAVATGGGPRARLAEAALRVVRREWDRAREAVHGLEGWEAGLLRGCVEGHDPAGDRTTAVREYTKVLEEGIAFAWVYNDRGTARRDLGDPHGSVRDYDRALRIRPGYPEALNNRGLVRKEQGELEGAIADLDAALAARPQFPAALVNRSLARRALGDPRGAIADCEEALRLEAHDPVALAARGGARRDSGDIAGAIADLDEALRLRPSFPEALSDRSQMRHALGDYPAALADSEAALRLRGDHADALNARANARRALGDLAGAVSDYDAALRSRPEFPEALTNRGNALASLGDLAGAVRDYDTALRLRPQLLGALNNRGAAREALGDLEGAVADFEATLRLAPTGWPHRRSVERNLADAREALAGREGGR